jgi:proline iminopeptidase
MTDTTATATVPAAGEAAGDRLDLGARRELIGRTLLVVGVCAVAGVIAAHIMPRGPVTAAHVVIGIMAGFVVGGVAGFVLRSRWAILLAPAVFVVANEITRIALTGPTVDRPEFSTMFGLLVLILGRGFQAVIQLLPMMLAAAVGAGVARRVTAGEPRPAGWHRAALWARRAVIVVVTSAIVLLGALLTQPGFTEPFIDADGDPVPGSVAELAEVSLGGKEQAVLLRGRSSTNPVLLYLAGGPGQSDLGYTRAYMTELEEDFVFAVWDQRGTGKSYPALDPVETLTLDRTVQDTIELTSYLADRFDQQKIYLMGSSWGTTLGVLAVQRRPDLFHAWIGTGQMASQLASDTIIYQQVLDYAARTGDEALAERMREYGPPPYRDMYAYAFVIDYYEKIGPYPKTTYFQTQGPPGIDGTGATEYGLLDKINKEKAIIDTAAVLYPQLQDVDFRDQVPALEVPVYLIQGAHELSARTEPAREWFDALQAPSKQWITFEDSGHIPQFEEFPRFRAALAQIVREQS